MGKDLWEDVEGFIESVTKFMQGYAVVIYDVSSADSVDEKVRLQIH